MGFRRSLVEGLLLDGGGTANVLAAGYRGQKLATLAEALGPVWEEYHKREKQAPEKKAEEAGKAPARSARANENGHDKKEVVTSGGDRSGTRCRKQTAPRVAVASRSGQRRSKWAGSAAVKPSLGDLPPWTQTAL
jgi:hypothetical protein